MIFPSMYYFLYYGAISILFPFLALFYQSQGLTGSQIGLLAAISPIISFFGAPLWTGAADASHRHKLVAILSITGVVIITFIFPGIASFGGLLLMISLYAFFGAPTGSLVDSGRADHAGQPQGTLRAHPLVGHDRLWHRGALCRQPDRPVGTQVGLLGLCHSDVGRTAGHYADPIPPEPFQRFLPGWVTRVVRQPILDALPGNGLHRRHRHGDHQQLSLCVYAKPGSQ